MSSSSSSPMKGKSILIIGGGAFGVSTAYHLAKRLDLSSSPSTTITIVDRFPNPSPIAASTDVNKIVRSDYSEPMYARLGVEAMTEWKKTTGMFSGMFQQTGWYLAAQKESLPFIEASVANQKKMGIEGVVKTTPEKAREITPSFSGPMKDWQMWWNPWAGWTTAGDALAAMTDEARRMGVRYISGDDGWIRRLLYSGDVCIGAESHNGSRHYADEVIISAGAASPTLLDFEGQLVAKGHVVGHIQLKGEEEMERYKSLKIVDHFEKGIIFPPNKDGIVKVATVNFVTNYLRDEVSGRVSVPRYRQDNPRDDVPKKVEREIREWLREFVPDLADREWVETRICWDTDTPDLHFIISPHPTHRGLNLATGGSAHGFKFLPIIGKYVADMMESKLDADLAHTWAWRPNRPRKEHQGPDPHPLPTRDLADFEDFFTMKSNL